MSAKRLTVVLFLLVTVFMAAQVVAAQAVTIPSQKAAGEQLQLPGILHKPSGNGPFPAVVMLCGCGGYAEGGTDVKQQASWAQRLVQWGYVALQVDSFSPRGFPNGVCDNPFNVNFDTRAGDAFAAKSYLSTLTFVDPNNIAVIGWSHGGIAVLRIIQGFGRDPEVRFKAAIAFYPYSIPVVFPDTPLLVLIGAKDDDSPASLAESLEKDYKIWNWKPELSLKIYPTATHVFDYDTLPPGGTNFMGHHFEYDPEATSDAIARTKDFLAKYIGVNISGQSIGGPSTASAISPSFAQPILQSKDVAASPCGCLTQ